MIQGYYRTAKAVTQLNTILLQTRSGPAARAGAAPAAERAFRVRGELLEIVDEDLFERNRPASSRVS